MNILSYPLRYLKLRNEAGRKLYRRDTGFVVIMATLLALPFILLDGNFFGAGGMLDRVGSFSSVLTGFYIAALVGVASLSTAVGDLDEVITRGPIFGPDADSGELEELTRRQYVCSLFGYLAFISLFVSISSIFAVVSSGLIDDTSVQMAQNAISKLSGYNINVAYYTGFFRCTLIAVYTLIISHVVATTCHGLYYYIDKIYMKSNVIVGKSDEDS
ncbi:hypothetical protein GOL95_29475 [Sinorhizobium medicae]|nr:hypothetical protein [Sinorhizobium medicae]MDX0839926.1 hypothetical protein [Sinorhizobium medicae]MDX1107919.1 hypothetical protein [Sinorhizobium medicae]MDX1120685.1 hypothetical protein [Sinorhizobium medicae]MDX1244071.1 hypothetical protein [Sinorhizobium medicae]